MAYLKDISYNLFLSDEPKEVKGDEKESKTAKNEVSYCFDIKIIVKKRNFMTYKL